MARTLDDYLQRSKRANSKEVSAARAVFDQAYGIACQVIELREKHNSPKWSWLRRLGSLKRRSAVSSGELSARPAPRSERLPKRSEPTCASSSDLSRALGVALPADPRSIRATWSWLRVVG